MTRPEPYMTFQVNTRINAYVVIPIEYEKVIAGIEGESK